MRWPSCNEKKGAKEDEVVAMHGMRKMSVVLNEGTQPNVDPETLLDRKAL